MSTSSPQRLAVKLKPNAERLVKKGHPWIFSESIAKINKEGRSGDLAILFNSKSNDVYGIGLYDPNSAIRIKVLSTKKTDINKSFFENRIDEAFSKRKGLLNSKTNAYRILFGENDGFPGFIADVYNNVLVIKLYNNIWFPYLELIYYKLVEVSSSKAVVIRLSRNLQKIRTNYKDGEVIYGELPSDTIQFAEHGLQFLANVIKGHKTGYFLDHRHNRKRVGAMATGKTVLDVFSYAGGFSVHALVGGAREVTSLDISRQALEIAQANAQLNSFSGIHHVLCGDAFDVLTRLLQENKKYDLVVVDPPSFAKRSSEIEGALKAYSRLVRLASKLTANKGVFVMASCSSRIPSDEFFKLVDSLLQNQDKNWIPLERTYHDIDHPIGFKEGAYLKCGYYKLD